MLEENDAELTPTTANCPRRCTPAGAIAPSSPMRSVAATQALRDGGCCVTVDFEADGPSPGLSPIPRLGAAVFTGDGAPTDSPDASAGNIGAEAYRYPTELDETARTGWNHIAWPVRNVRRERSRDPIRPATPVIAQARAIQPLSGPAGGSSACAPSVPP